MKKEQTIPNEAVLCAIPKEHTIIYPLNYNNRSYEIEYTFLDQKDENDHYSLVGMRVFRQEDKTEFGVAKRIEIGGSYNNILIHFVNHTLNTVAPRKNFEALLSAHVQKAK